MKNVLIIKGADFSADKVETIPLVDIYSFTDADYINGSLKLQVQASPATTFTTNNNYYGAFLPISEYQGCPVKITNTGSKSEYVAFIKNPTFQVGGSYAFGGNTDLVQIKTDSPILETTIPDDAEYLYVMIVSGGTAVTSTVEITAPIG